MHPEAPNQPSRADCAAQVPRAAALGSEAAPMGAGARPSSVDPLGPVPACCAGTSMGAVLHRSSRYAQKLGRINQRFHTPPLIQTSFGQRSHCNHVAPI